MPDTKLSALAALAAPALADLLYAPRLVTLAVSAGTLVLLGAAVPLDAANTMRVYSWTYDGTRTIVGPSEVSV